MERVVVGLIVVHGLGMVVCTAVLVGMLSATNARLTEVESNTRRVVEHTQEMASTTRVQYEPTTFQIVLSDRSKKYAPGHGIPACAARVRSKLNGDEQSLEDLVGQGYYVVSTSTHSQTGNQTDRETGELKPESETGYRTCDTTGLLYILRKDLAEGGN